MADETLWAVHVGGSDEYLAMPDWATAETNRATFDRFDAQNANLPPTLAALTPRWAAEVVEWPAEFSREAHAQNLARQVADRGVAR